jgi:hypothetical protein
LPFNHVNKEPADAVGLQFGLPPGGLRPVEEGLPCSPPLDELCEIVPHGADFLEQGFVIGGYHRRPFARGGHHRNYDLNIPYYTSNVHPRTRANVRAVFLALLLKETAFIRDGGTQGRLRHGEAAMG